MRIVQSNIQMRYYGKHPQQVFVSNLEVFYGWVRMETGSLGSGRRRAPSYPSSSSKSFRTERHYLRSSCTIVRACPLNGNLTFKLASARLSVAPPHAVTTNPQYRHLLRSKPSTISTATTHSYKQILAAHQSSLLPGKIPIRTAYFVLQYTYSLYLYLYHLLFTIDS